MNYGTLVLYDGSTVLIEVDSPEREGVRFSDVALAADGRTIVAGEASGRVHFLKLENA